MRLALPHLLAAAATLSASSAQSYNNIPEIEVFGQHFFYTNNGSQLCANPMSIVSSILLTS